MAMVNNETHCFICNEEKITFPCEGCSKEFCSVHLTEHQQILNELNHIVINYNELKERISKQKQNPIDHSLIEQINQWQIDSIEKIKQKAHEYKEILIESSQTCITDTEMKFNSLNEQMKQIHQENELNEINLEYLRNQLLKMRQQLNKSSKVFIQENSQSFINDVSFILLKPKFNKWKQNAITVAGGNGRGEKTNQLKYPHGIFIDENKNIFIADCANHRIVEWKYNANEGQIIAGGNGPGNQMNQLNQPTDVIVEQKNHSIIIADARNRRVIQWLNQTQQILIDNIDCFGLAIDKKGFLYVSDIVKNEVRRWKMGEYNNEGIVVPGGNENGSQLNQLNSPGLIFVDEDQSVYVTDNRNHRVMKWRKDATEGRIVAGEKGRGRDLNQLFYPEGVIVDDLGQIYVADGVNNRVIRCYEGKEEGEIVVGGNGSGSQPNQLTNPSSLSFDDEGNLYVADFLNYRIEKFEIIL
ncbi:unnamed protein product [Adineta steineri]|uniref:Uncharacterized protein n=1 Tax=Adineta steineri TaxID=433720 RepID=A0A816D4A3_9BILA|nr:unnamed protein product [Adineta steineri]CAF1631486.1 unnamed protein product [Adineta steineri]